MGGAVARSGAPAGGTRLAGSRCRDHRRRRGGALDGSSPRGAGYGRCAGRGTELRRGCDGGERGRHRAAADQDDAGCRPQEAGGGAVVAFAAPHRRQWDASVRSGRSASHRLRRRSGRFHRTAHGREQPDGPAGCRAPMGADPLRPARRRSGRGDRTDGLSRLSRRRCRSDRRRSRPARAGTRAGRSCGGARRPACTKGLPPCDWGGRRAAGRFRCPMARS